MEKIRPIFEDIDVLPEKAGRIGDVEGKSPEGHVFQGTVTSPSCAGAVEPQKIPPLGRKKVTQPSFKFWKHHSPPPRYAAFVRNLSSSHLPFPISPLRHAPVPKLSPISHTTSNTSQKNGARPGPKDDNTEATCGDTASTPKHESRHE